MYRNIANTTHTPHKPYGYLLYFMVLLLLLCPALAFSASHSTHDWDTWLAQFRREALADGIQANVFDMAFANVTPDKRVLSFDRNQPEQRITFLEYRHTRIDAYRITIGRKKYQQHHEILTEIGNAYGVSPCIIVALWGMESSYGLYMGTFPVIRSLATLAFDGRRSDFFRNELLLALHILQEGHVSLAQFKGEWAGASGHPQFLPSSWKKYAVDYDKDGKKDIWNNLDDVFASIANYLKQNGWEKNQPWAIEVTAPAALPRGFETPAQPVSKWLQLGVQPSSAHPQPQLMGWLLEPLGGPTLLVFNNFNVIKSYNNSNFYAGSVGYLADRICQTQ